MSAASFVEAAVVVEAQTRASGTRQFDAFFRRAGIVIEPVTEEQTHAARQAYTDFGKGCHAAGLNFGDCFAYALAKITGEPLLFKGKFEKTDVKAAVRSAPVRFSPGRARDISAGDRTAAVGSGNPLSGPQDAVSAFSEVPALR